MNDETLKSQPTQPISITNTATLEFHTELAESGREIPRLRDFFSNPANFEQHSYAATAASSSISSNNHSGNNGNFPLHKAPSIQTFDSLDLTRYSDDVDQNKFQDDKIAVLEFELRKAKETINQLRNTLTLATEAEKPNNEQTKQDKSTKNVKINKENNPFLSDELSNDDDYDYIEITKTDENKQSNVALMPHDKNAINFLVNEYLLEQNFKMTSVTFSEENESQDLEDWDVVGLNRSKPPSICQLYKLYLNKKNDSQSPSKETKGVEKPIIKTEIGIQVSVDISAQSTNTELVSTRDFETLVNFDHERSENQRLQISKLLEKQEILIKSISKLEKEISNLNLERESNLKKIDSLSIALDKAIVTSHMSENKEIVKHELENNELKQKEEEIQRTAEHNLSERNIPVVFKDFLNKQYLTNFEPNNQLINEEISKLKSSQESFIDILLKYLPIIATHVAVEKRLDILPLFLFGAILEQQQISNTLNNNKNECILLKLLFNFIEKPNLEQRSMILNSCIQFIKFAGPMYVNNYLLPQCWEQLNDKSEERRMLVAEACAALAPHIYMEMRSSLMFSIIKQIIEQEKSDLVRLSAVKSLSILINYLKDERKFIQCIELLDLCATDQYLPVVQHVEQIMLPSMSLWALMIEKFHEPFMMHLVDKAEFYLLNKNNKLNETHAKTYLDLLQMNLQFVFAYILIHFRDKSSLSRTASSEDEKQVNNTNGEQLSKLNAYYYSLHSKLDLKNDLYKLDSILEDYLKLTNKYLSLIESDSWSTVELSNAFTWLSDKLIRRLIQMSAQVDAKDPLCAHFVKFFNDFIYLFRIDFDLIKSKIIPIFEKLLNISSNETDSDQQEAIEKMIVNKSCPLFKSILPVYFVGIISTIVDIELFGSLNLNHYEIVDPNSITFNGSPQSNKNSPRANNTNMNQSAVEKRLNHMSSYLRNIFFTLSLNQSNLDGLIAIYEQMKHKTKFDYVNQMLLSTLWDGIVHNSLYVRCNTAKLFEILVKNCDEYLLSTRILPALITLANDLDKMVRCSSISPLTCIIECCNNKEILERVYTQLQSFLSDPILKDEYVLQIELLKTFRRITLKSNSKFREEFILPYLAILALQIKNVINDNDYEFSQSALTASFSSISSLSSSYSSNTPSSKENQQNHQNDLLKICVLLFDIYQKLFSTNSDNKIVHISRQSVQESLLPGLNCLKDIFLNNIINSNSHNEYVQQMDNLMHKTDLLQQQHTNSHSEHQMVAIDSNLISSSNSMPVFNAGQETSPLKQNNTLANTATSAALGDMVNASISTLTSSNGSIDNTNFKSFVFKGITNFKDHSKDKLSNFLLTNKTFKK